MARLWAYREALDNLPGNASRAALTERDRSACTNPAAQPQDFVSGIGTTNVYGGAHLYRVPFDDMRSIKGVGGKTFLDFFTIGADGLAF